MIAHGRLRRCNGIGPSEYRNSQQRLSKVSSHAELSYSPTLVKVRAEYEIMGWRHQLTHSRNEPIGNQQPRSRMTGLFALTIIPAACTDYVNCERISVSQLRQLKK
jgi:hypothetical protein